MKIHNYLLVNMIFSESILLICHSYLYIFCSSLDAFKTIPNPFKINSLNIPHSSRNISIYKCYSKYIFPLPIVLAINLNVFSLSLHIVKWVHPEVHVIIVDCSFYRWTTMAFLFPFSALLKMGTTAFTVFT